MPQGEIKLLPLSEEEQAALLMAITLVLNSISTMGNKDLAIKMIMEIQVKPLESIKQKLQSQRR